MTHVIEARALSRRFRDRDAVQALTLDVPAGSICALVGPNGAGKTTTIKLLMNLLRPSGGEARVLGTDSRRLGHRDFQRIGYISENQDLPGWMTPAGLLEHVRPFYPTWDDDLCGTLRHLLGLGSVTARIRHLSRGTRMKVALLSSLAYRPELIVLDEPFSGLDPLARDELVSALLELPGATDRPCTMLVSSHDIEEVERLADRIGFLQNGRLLFAEDVASLLGRFRRVEVVLPDVVEAPQSLPASPDWLEFGGAGRTLRFVDTAHDRPGAAARIAQSWPEGHVETHPMSLREIVVTLTRHDARATPVEAVAS